VKHAAAKLELDRQQCSNDKYPSRSLNESLLGYFS
jgi:hypothetical protein